MNKVCMSNILPYALCNLHSASMWVWVIFFKYLNWKLRLQFPLKWMVFLLKVMSHFDNIIKSYVTKLNGTEENLWTKTFCYIYSLRDVLLFHFETFEREKKIESCVCVWHNDAYKKPHNHEIYISRTEYLKLCWQKWFLEIRKSVQINRITLVCLCNKTYLFKDIVYPLNANCTFLYSLFSTIASWICSYNYYHCKSFLSKHFIKFIFE